MRLTTRGEPKDMRSGGHPGMVVLSLPVVLTDEHAASSYGIPVILRNDEGHQGELIDYHQMKSVHMPQGDADGETFEPLATGAGFRDAETPYSRAVAWVRQLEQFGVHITGILPNFLPAGTRAVADSSRDVF